MPFLPADVCPVDLLPDGNVRALAPVTWTGTRGDTVTVPAGYVSDLGSVPKALRAILPHDGPASRAFLIHDVLCTRLHEYQAALDAHEAEWKAPGWPAEGTPEWKALQVPIPPVFSAVDVDNVLRVILAELGVGPVRWIYWEGVRCGAIGSAERRRGFGASLLPFLALAVPTLIVCAPAAAGAIASRILLGIFSTLAWPWERLARHRRDASTARVLAQAAPCPYDAVRCEATCEDRTACAVAVIPAGHTTWITHAPWPALSDETPGGTR